MHVNCLHLSHKQVNGKKKAESQRLTRSALRQCYCLAHPAVGYLPCRWGWLVDFLIPPFPSTGEPSYCMYNDQTNAFTIS